MVGEFHNPGGNRVILEGNLKNGYYIEPTGLIINNDEDYDGVCNSDEILGCQDILACNFNIAS